MKKYFFAVAVTIMALAMTAGSSMASGTQTVAVSANVTGVCQFLTGGSISFTLDPSVGGNVNGTVTQPTFWCTNGTSYTITDDSGVNEIAAGSPRMVSGSSATDFIPYSLTYTAAGAGTGRTSVITMDIASTVVAADYLDALVGAYSDTVTLTINP